MLADHGDSWQSNNEESDQIIFDADKTKELEVHAGVVKTKRGKVWTP